MVYKYCLEPKWRTILALLYNTDCLYVTYNNHRRNMPTNNEEQKRHHKKGDGGGKKERVEPSYLGVIIATVYYSSYKGSTMIPRGESSNIC